MFCHTKDLPPTSYGLHIASTYGYATRAPQRTSFASSMMMYGRGGQRCISTHLRKYVGMLVQHLGPAPCHSEHAECDYMRA